jgi:hypothetical protein
MQRLFPVTFIVAALVLISVPETARAQVGTPLSAGTYRAGKIGFAGWVGFPYLSIEGGYGIADRFDLSLFARAAWSDIQRVGLKGRFRLSQPGSPSGFAVRASIDSWTGRPSRTDWIQITGLQDVTGTLDGVFSWSTPRGTVMSISGGVQLVGNRQPPVTPLGGIPPSIVFGPNAILRLSAEIPHSSGVLFAFDFGFDIHLSGFDDAIAMPAFSVGIGYVL